MTKDLRSFLAEVRELGSDYYVEVNKPLKPELEISILQRKLAKNNRFPVIYCPKILGSNLPLVTNLFSSYELLGLALGMDPRRINKSDIFHEFRRRRGDAKPVKWVSNSEAPVKEVILKGQDADLSLLPIIKQEKLNSGKYISAGQLVCTDPVTATPNVGIYRHEVKGKRKLGAMIAPGHHGDYIAKHYTELGKPMEVVIFIGHHPAVAIASEFTGAIDVNELEIAGGYLGEPLQVVRAETVSIPVPARAEIAIEGVIDPTKKDTDGPYSEYLGYYGREQECFVIDVTAITMRKDAIYHNLGASTREHNILGGSIMSFALSIYESVKNVVPTVIDVHLPPSGGCISTAYVSIAKRVPGEGKRAGLAAVNAVASTKIAVVVDEDIDVYDEEQVHWAIATRVDPNIDIDIIPRILGGHLDPTAYDETRLKSGKMTSKMIIDATEPVELPFATRVTPDPEVWERIKLEDYLDD